MLDLLKACFTMVGPRLQARRYLSAVASGLASGMAERSLTMSGTGRRIRRSGCWPTELRHLRGDGRGAPVRGGLVIGTIDETGQQQHGEAIAGVQVSGRGCDSPATHPGSWSVRSSRCWHQQSASEDQLTIERAIEQKQPEYAYSQSLWWTKPACGLAQAGRLAPASPARMLREASSAMALRVLKLALAMCGVMMHVLIPTSG
jgi:hypothetical protein